MSAGKGSKPRPVNLAKYQANYDAIFRKRPVGRGLRTRRPTPSSKLTAPR